MRLSAEQLAPLPDVTKLWLQGDKLPVRKAIFKKWQRKDVRCLLHVWNSELDCWDAEPWSLVRNGFVRHEGSLVSKHGEWLSLRND